MSSSDSNSVRNGVLATVLGSVLLTVIGNLWPPAKDALMRVWAAIAAGVQLLSDSYPVQGWVLLTIGLLALVTLVRLVVGLRPGQAPSYVSFTEQRLHGAIWRWRWREGNISNLWCYCPNCDMELVYDDSTARGFVRVEEPRTDFFCERCNGSVVARIPGGDKEYALGSVSREIHRRIRTGEYEKEDRK